MQHNEMLLFFSYQRRIFGICPCCGDFFRLSDCKIYKDERKSSDWLERLHREAYQLEQATEKMETALELHKQEAREKGRKQANRKVRKVDTVFAPRKLNPDEAKVIFHPVDFVVFNGMKTATNGEGLRNLLLLDGQEKTTEGRAIQKSVATAVERERYEWLTLRVKDNGTIETE
jgi:predicted Holliday junction resolvase-like endonuclease